MPRQSIIPAMFTALAGGIILLVVTLWPPEVGAYMVVFAPDSEKTTRLSAVLRAGGRIIETSETRPYLVAWSDDRDFIRRVRREGAWFSIDAAAGFGCAPKRRSHTFSDGAK